MNRARFAAVLFVFAIVFAIRWWTLGGLGGDDHWSLWNAATFLKGDRPFRDFIDVGDPLYWAASAVAQALFGYRVLGEVVLGVSLIAFALAISFHLAWNASRSLTIAAFAAMLVLLLVTTTKLYSYPKIFVYPLGMWLSWRYIDRPTWLRAVGLAFGVVVAFGYRHDHGAYVGVGAAAAVLAAHWPEGTRKVLVSMVRFGVLLLLLLAPYFTLIQMTEGLVEYFRSRMDFAKQLDEAGRRSVPFVADSAAPLLWAGVAPPPPASVAITWQSNLPPERRQSLERQYSLLDGRGPNTRLREYELIDLSRPNLTALISDSRIEQTEGIVGSFRRGYEIRKRPTKEAILVVEWMDSVTEPLRARLERQYHLVNRRNNVADPTGRSLVYDIADISEENLTGIVYERYLSVAEGIDPVSVPQTVVVEEPPRPGAEIWVRWREDVSDPERADLEQKYKLINRRPHPEDPWRRGYDLADFSDANATALAKDPGVAGTDGLTDGAARGTYSVAHPPLSGARVYVRWAENATDEERSSLERHYQLRPTISEADLSWSYTLADMVQSNVQALLKDPAVLNVGGLDPQTSRPIKEPWSTAIRRDVPLMGLTIAPRIFHEQNAGPWIYYLSMTLPFLVLILIAADRLRGIERSVMSHEHAKMFAVAVMMIIANAALLRKLGYMADHADVAAVLGAWLLGRAVGTGFPPRPRRSRIRATGRALGMIGLIGILLVTMVAVGTYAHPLRLADRFELSSGLDAAWENLLKNYRGYAISPPIDGYAPPGITGDRGLIRYVYECTRPDDRVWVLSDVYTLPYYTERRVVRHIYWGMNFQTSPDLQRQTIAQLEKDEVPLIIGVGGRRPLQYLEGYDQIHQYVSQRYTQRIGIVEDNQGRGLAIWVLFDSRRKVTGTHELFGLPCFR